MASSAVGPVVGATTAAAGHHIHHLDRNAPVADVPVIPTGFPETVVNESAWTGPQFTKQSQYTYSLTNADLDELAAALKHFKTLGLDGDLVSRDNFPLPTLGATLDGIARDIHQGKGFAVVRGIDPQQHSVEDLTILYLGVQGYVANQRARQDKKGNMLVHIVADNTSQAKADHHRHSTSAITFHNEESGDVISWLTRNTAAAGGKCIIASAHTVYNVLAATRPDIIRTLSRSDWPFALPKFQCRPILFHHDGKIIINFGRTPLMGNSAHPRPVHFPSLSARQIEALDAVEAIAKATQMEIQTRAGDIHFINNLAILHRREAFVNGQGASEKRHLVRMRVRNEQLGWSIPDALKREWHDAFDKPADRVWHLEPMPDAFFPLRKYPN
ncbi:TfdA family Taurine catabolism dioxygenase TauD [Colletotrichum paranaense]|uniref:TfdA family Taurine catabolism dioxygenase TauD n=1 Tax=Colletotrichum paranaense TaxID=1914294 RepID=A0ABQ9S1B4_9PEZI|nr:TfdA family Taurine catabolism dioxygenase TauD [Colletotrichum paranaense]KAK1521816.1 TfdA family Taurine catabolism dioxygenase TauD [Colletotrichum paranaense]